MALSFLSTIPVCVTNHNVSSNSFFSGEKLLGNDPNAFEREHPVFNEMLTDVGKMIYAFPSGIPSNFACNRHMFAYTAFDVALVMILEFVIAVYLSHLLNMQIKMEPCIIKRRLPI